MSSTSTPPAPSDPALSDNEREVIVQASRSGSIAGGVVGGVVVIGLMLFGWWWYRKRLARKTQAQQQSKDIEGSIESPPSYDEQRVGGPQELEQPKDVPPSFRPQEMESELKEVHEMQAKDKALEMQTSDNVHEMQGGLGGRDGAVELPAETGKETTNEVFEMPTSPQSSKEVGHANKTHVTQ